MSVTIANDKTTIHDSSLPRAHMSLHRIRKLHVRMLRHFAITPGFDQKGLTVRIRAKHSGKFTEFNNFKKLAEWARGQSDKSLEALELSYQYAKFAPSTTTHNVITMNASVMFGEAGQNQCMITSNYSEWANFVHSSVIEAIEDAKITPLARFLRRGCFTIAVACLLLFAIKLFPINSAESFITVVVFFITGAVAGWPTKTPPFKQWFANRLTLN